MAGDDLSDILDKRMFTRYIYATAMMKSGSHQDSAQAMQRVRVGLTGLAMVLVLIGLMSAIFSSASRDGPATAVGASNVSVIANMTEGNASVAAATGKDEPLAELGAAPSTGSSEQANASAAKKIIDQPQQ